MDPSSGPSRPPAADAEHEHELRQHDAEPDLGPERDQQEEEQKQHEPEPEHQTHQQQQQHQPRPDPDRLVAVSPAAVDSAVVARDDAEDKLLTAPDASSDTAPVATHLARFEFSDHGTKILMVEWYPGAAAAPTLSGQDTTNASVDVVSSDKAGPQSHDIHADDALAAPAQPVPVPSSPVVDAAVWEVSWPGKSTFLPARDTDEDDARRRVYFMLPPEAPVPATVTIARPGRPSLILKPLPAIFPEYFQAESGPRGVLHTIWAKKRLRELELEMEAEMRANAESVGLEMALAEKQWIVDNFLRAPPSPTPTAMTPRSPVTGRLGDKLKGLRLATSPADLVPSPAANTFTSPESQSHMLSPLGGDIAVSSFAAISRSRPTGPMSLDAALRGDAAPPQQQPDGQDAEEDLFALPMSPRSPDMIKSPFSALGLGPGP
ncbi:uncharacterized protein Triagg1_6259 [Trichoderma aggressivum f. europaeum]|uniref:Uncharacterized protein n=1 Tax=Trichoderma aggressivum f. europaeum TaxID=173218 RepID=A0AAE1LZN2_9HYPO|nr:hypothetical protein Triagg1_6259 [Trichoderma aggressivum f. europaeum]